MIRPQLTLLPLLLALAPAWAVPTYQSPLTAPETEYNRPPLLTAHCGQARVPVELEMRGEQRLILGYTWGNQANGDWVEGMRGDELAELDNNPGGCRLNDAGKDTGTRINYGVDWDRVFKKIAEMEEQPREADDEDDAKRDPHPHLRLEFSEADHQLHAFLEDGMGGRDLGPLSGEEQTPSWEGRNDPLRARGGGQNQAQAGQLRTPLSPVPEPSAWAMLLGGLAALALWRRVSERKARPAARR